MYMFFILFVCLCSKVLFVKSEATNVLKVKVIPNGNCTVLPAHTFSHGDNVSFIIETKPYIDFGWVRNLNSPSSENDILKLKSIQGKYEQTFIINTTQEGIWEFEVLHSKNNYDMVRSLQKTYNGSYYTQAICRTNVSVIPPEPASMVDPITKYWIIGTVLGVVILAIIVAQTVCIVYLKAKARDLNPHRHLSKKSEPTENDRARYCSNPGQKMTKIVAPADDDSSRESVIYEAPNLELLDRTHIVPPQPPAINTIPRTPRADHNMRVGHQAMLAAAMNYSSQHTPFPARQPEMNVANRPPLPLPQEDVAYEVYEEMDPIVEDTYEQPPAATMVPPRTIAPRPVIPEKKVAVPKLPDVQKEAMNLRTGGRKPLVTPKPQSPASNNMQMNELEMAFKKRINKSTPAVVNTRGPPVAVTPAQRDPSPVVNLRPKGPPAHVPQPVQADPPPNINFRPRSRNVDDVLWSRQPAREEIYFNERTDSSDEEWTYEPLKPYDANIYNNI